ncbi:MAG: Mth938-like domain-containing protein [Alphaproteobacteria bacterium]|nr:Mth938-like domain-containing protein [Alphaproteobacteria bacterium]
MDITPPVAADRQLIQGYGDGGFRVSGRRHMGSILVLPHLTLPWPLDDIANLSLEDLGPIRDASEPVGVLLLGCGNVGALIAPKLRAEVREWGVVIEAMDTGAACRTYNVLLSEDRDVAAALIAIS